MTSSDPYARAEEAATALRARFGVTSVDAAFVLGSGWSAAAESLGTEIGHCPLEELPHFAAPVVLGHGGLLRVVRTRRDKVAVVFTGRTHLYEGRGVEPVVHGVRTAIVAGARVVVLTNGCGCLRREWDPGTPVLLSDHINLSGATPLVGPRFIDLTAVYSPRLRALARDVEPDLPEGVYVQFHGPQFETPAEVRMAGAIGGDLVGMSTTVEAVAARELGAEVLGISLVTNLAAGISPEPLNHAEVLAAGAAAAPRLTALLSGLADRL